MEKQLLGSEVGLKHNSPLNMEHDGKTGHPMVQEVGTSLPLSETPTGLHTNEAIKEGTRQTLGSQAPLSMTPRRGWQSHDTPMSDRAKVQGEN